MLVPIILLGLLVYRRNKLPEFQERAGALIDSADVERQEYKWVVILIPALFFLRRLFLVFTIIFLLDFFWAQIAI